jgi:hypothetical protein
MVWYPFPQLGFQPNIHHCKPINFQFALDTADSGGDVAYNVVVVGDYVFLRIVADDCRDEGYFRPDPSKVERFWSSLRECKLLQKKSEFYTANLEKLRWTVAIRRHKRVIESSGNQSADGFDHLLGALSVLIDDSRLKRLSRPTDF